MEKEVVGDDGRKGAEPAPASALMVPLYLRWRGNNIFCCGGRCATGPDIKMLIFTLLLVAVPGTLFAVCVGGPLWTRLSPAVLVLGALQLLVIVVALLNTAFRDPGILPRAEAPPVDPEHPEGPPAAWKDTVIDGHPFRLKYCSASAPSAVPRLCGAPTAYAALPRRDVPHLPPAALFALQSLQQLRRAIRPSLYPFPIRRRRESPFVCRLRPRSFTHIRDPVWLHVRGPEPALGCATTASLCCSFGPRH